MLQELNKRETIVNTDNIRLMKTYRTTFDIPVNDSPLTYNNPVMLIGSCFTENIGERLQELKFPADVNPFGVIYNPLSVKNSLDILIRKKEFSQEDLYFYDNQWISFYHQTSFSHPNPEKCLEVINDRINQSAASLKKADYLFITFGTARVYEWKENNQVVSNCHKIPANKFSRRLLSPKEITNTYAQLIEELADLNPGLKIIFTVSPIRHWKDGAVGNQMSKATLLLAVRNLVENACQYTPESGTIEISGQRSGSEIKVVFTNSGSTISEEDLPYIFERFYRADQSRSRPAGGAGIELAIVKELIEAHSGSVGADSSEPETSIWFTLPL